MEKNSVGMIRKERRVLVFVWFSPVASTATSFFPSFVFIFFTQSSFLCGVIVWNECFPCAAFCSLLPDTRWPLQSVDFCFLCFQFVWVSSELIPLFFSFRFASLDCRSWCDYMFVLSVCCCFDCYLCRCLAVLVVGVTQLEMCQVIEFNYFFFFTSDLWRSFINISQPP